jgi:hypothetical protein
MPSNWNGGTITYIAYWTAAAGATGALTYWELQGRALADGNAFDQAFGTAVQVSDALLAWDSCHVTAESGAVTLAGSPAGSQRVHFRFSRMVGATGATVIAANTRLLALVIKYTVT